MKQNDIDDIPIDIFRNINPFLKRGCATCNSLSPGLVNWWCKNENAVKDRGTSIPGCIKCPYWTPNKKYVDLPKGVSKVICPDGKSFKLNM